MPMPTILGPAPEIVLPDQDGVLQRLSDRKGKWTLVYFYPKDDTPGCTIESCGFRDRIAEFSARGCEIFGISGDSVESHKAFAAKYQLPFRLLADTGLQAVTTYGVWKDGILLSGIARTSFLVDPEGTIAKVYSPVQALTHPQQVLSDLDSLAPHT